MDVEKMATLQWRTINLILDLLPCTIFSPYLQELLFHSAAVKRRGHGMLNSTEEISKLYTRLSGTLEHTFA